jgi:hypothetical protein
LNFIKARDCDTATICFLQRRTGLFSVFFLSRWSLKARVSAAKADLLAVFRGIISENSEACGSHLSAGGSSVPQHYRDEQGKRDDEFEFGLRHRPRLCQPPIKLPNLAFGEGTHRARL